MFSWFKKRLQGVDNAGSGQTLSVNDSANIEEHTTTEGINQSAIEEAEQLMEAGVVADNTIERLSPAHNTPRELDATRSFPNEILEETIALEGYIHPPAALLNQPVIDTGVDPDELELSKTRLANALL